MEYHRISSRLPPPPSWRAGLAKPMVSGPGLRPGTGRNSGTLHATPTLNVPRVVLDCTTWKPLIALTWRKGMNIHL